MNKLIDVLENLGIRTKKNGIIDFRTTVGAVSNKFAKLVANVETDYIETPIKKAIAKKPSSELPTEEITEKVVRRVIDGKVVKDEDEQTKRRKANSNSSLTRAERTRISKKSANTRSKDKAGVRKSVEERSKAAAKRAVLGLNKD